MQSKIIITSSKSTPTTLMGRAIITTTSKPSIQLTNFLFNHSITLTIFNIKYISIIFIIFSFIKY
jgi:hypothetical protein